MAGGDDDGGLDVTGELSDGELSALFAALDSDEFTVADGILAAAEARAAERNPGGNAATLRRYWVSGAGAARIRWGTGGDWTRCVKLVGKYMTDENAKGYCANLHHAATGEWPNPGKKNDTKKAAGKAGGKAGGKRDGALRRLVRKVLRRRGAQAEESLVDAIADLTPVGIEEWLADGDEPAAQAAVEALVSDYLGNASVTEATEKPYGDVEYADPGYQADGKKRYPLDTAKHRRAAWSYINQTANAGKYTPGQLERVKGRIAAALKKEDGIEVSDESREASIGGQRSFSDAEALVRAALAQRAKAGSGGRWVYIHICDLTAGDVVYMDDVSEYPARVAQLHQCSYSIDSSGNVTLGEPAEVVRTYAPAPSAPAAESERAAEPVTELGRVLEARGDAPDGGRVFRVRIINEGDSANGRRYRRPVLEAAAGLYEGARAFNHHRTKAELHASGVSGLVGHVENVSYGDGGLDADLHLLPTAAHEAAVLDATVAAQEAGRPHLAGISHDAMARFEVVHENGRAVNDTASITAVNSVDIVAVPAAGGRATRVLAGGEIEQEDDVTVTIDGVLAALREASDEQLAQVGLARATAGGTGQPPGEPESFTRDGGLARVLIEGAVARAGLPGSLAESVRAALPDRVTEAQVDAHVASLVAARADLERAGLVPSAQVAQVTQESLDKKRAALDAFWDTSPSAPSARYRSFREAYIDISGRVPRAFDEDFSRQMLRESFGGGFDSGRAVESMDSSTWAQVLGDSVTRRMIAMYQLPGLQNWRKIVSSITSPTDFRTQRRPRWGGYGTLPTVAEGGPYQPLTSPGDEEATFSVSKKGGTEDVTWEMIKNDDVGQIQTIPTKLGRAAAQTLYRFVWDLLAANATCTYDSTTLFHTNHGNTATSAALAQSTLDTGRFTMHDQTAYGDTSEFIDPSPRYLVVPNELEAVAFQLTTSAVVKPSSGESSDMPNIHSANGLEPIRIPYWTDANDWFLVADPALIPTIEIGFLDGRDEPELFTQLDPTQGSVFSADKFTWKIRQVYSGAVLDHRGFYRGQG